MLRLLADENFKGAIVRGLWLRRPGLDLVRVQDVGLASVSDPVVLAWAARDGRIVLTHDRATMADYAYSRLADGEEMPGLFVLSDQLPVGQAVQEILFISDCSEQVEWSGQVVYLPL